MAVCRVRALLLPQTAHLRCRGSSQSVCLHGDAVSSRAAALSLCPSAAYYKELPNKVGDALTPEQYKVG